MHELVIYAVVESLGAREKQEGAVSEAPGGALGLIPGAPRVIKEPSKARECGRMFVLILGGA